MDNQSAFQTQPAYVQRASNRRRLVIIFLVVLLLIIAALGALYLLGSSAKKTTQPPTTPIPTAETITATPTPASVSAKLTPTSAVTPTGAAADVSTLNVSVLNGSGVPGAASNVATSLKSAGYSNITTGNASAFTYTGITIHVKKSSYLAPVEKAVSDAEPNAKVATSVDTTITPDIEVIVGK
jgi:hypothetical protein